MKRNLTCIGVWLLMKTQFAHGVAVTPQEMTECRRWVAAKFEGIPETRVPEPGLLVLANNDPVQKNSRGGKPLNIAGKQYTRGLYCHAASKVVVRLPGPGKTFDAVVGVDTNDQTKGGRGSIVFSVNLGGTEAFRTDVRREGMPASPVHVELGGATEFVLEVGDAGDGISCDQADWADAKVTLADGKEIWLGDMPLVEGPQRGPYTTEPPFSFVYDGQPSTDLFKTWELKRGSRNLDDQRTERTLTYSDPKTGLVVRCVAIEYRDFPTVEWTVYFKNSGTVDSPILENLQALDVRLERSGRNEFLLHHGVGSQANRSDYRPLETPLSPNTTKRISAAGGRPTNTDLSYFNLEGEGEGTIIVIGWPGQWAADFVRNEANGVHITAGQELTHFKLLPGEEVRTPLIALQFWKGGDWIRSQNLWRRWMMAHSMPKRGGKLPPPQFVAASSRAYEEMMGANEENQIMHIDRYIEEKLKIDYWWMDAGWYIQQQGWPQVGTWEVDPKRFPKGFRPVSDHAHSKGVKILVWFEPERVAAGTWLADNHPEWILGGKNGGLLDLGNSAARNWLTDHIDRLLTEQGIDLYRQDFNMDPLGHWRGNDAPDRQGITEIRHVTGLLEYWDELRRRHPNMLIDTCASGGRRNDLETLRRAVPLWRSDYAFEPIGHQCMTYGISLWIPYHGTGTVACVNAGYYGGGWTPVEPYAFWSNAAPSLGSGVDVRVKNIDYDALRKLVNAWRQTSSCYFGDYYPLTSYTQDNDQWIAWQFDSPESGEGMVQAFRRSDSFYESARFRLKGLDPEALYSVKRVDTAKSVRRAGKALMEQGLLIDIKDQPGASVLVYKRSKKR
ncbi:MAG: alpha-galactosidase [Armatimonadetes bacterium]|nr:alpha-galactosidase [Armatimonadota bacterium]